MAAKKNPASVPVGSANRIPKRASLVEETTAVLKEGIAGGRWLEVLPGEHELGAELHISRSTLRKALQLLYRQGVLAGGGHGKRHQVVATARRGRHAAGGAWQGTEVRVLCSLPERELISLTKTALQHFHSEVEAANLKFRFECAPRLKSRRPGTYLKLLTDQPGVAGWVLLGASAEVQHWFAESGLPAMVFGARFPGVRLPCAEYASHAVGRHAGLEFLRRGHRRIAFIHPAVNFAGDNQCDDGLREAVRQQGGEAEVIDGKFEPTQPGIRRTMELLLARQSPPTAFFVTQPNFVWPVIGCLQLAGRVIPRDAAVISRANDLFLATAVPEVARYRHDGANLGKVAARLMVSLINGGTDPTSSRTVMPEFIAGETIGPVPPKAT
jgi:hypothetical protein